jgi:transcriptional regulator with XRE-family HTH domain
MITVERARQWLVEQHRVPMALIAKDTGISLSWISAFRSGYIKDPSYSRLVKLEKYIEIENDLNRQRQARLHELDVEVA